MRPGYCEIDQNNNKKLLQHWVIECVSEWEAGYCEIYQNKENCYNIEWLSEWQTGCCEIDRNIKICYNTKWMSVWVNDKQVVAKKNKKMLQHWVIECESEWEAGYCEIDQNKKKSVGSTGPSQAYEYCLLRSRFWSIFTAAKDDIMMSKMVQSHRCCYWRTILDQPVTPLNRPYAPLWNRRTIPLSTTLPKWWYE